MPSTIAPSRRRLALTLSIVAATTMTHATVAHADGARTEAPPRSASAVGYAVVPPAKQDPWTSTPSAPTGPGYATPTRDRAGEEKRDERAAPSPFALDVAATAEMPIMMGGQVTLEVPYRFLFQGEVGVLPGFAVDAVDSALVGAGAYDSTTSDLVRNGLRGSVVGRLSAGWRPFADHGFEILGGYTVASFGGGVSARQAVEAAAQMAIPSQIPDTDIVVHTTIHCFHLSLGWRWVIADHFLVRTSIGYLQAVGSSSHVDVPDALAGNATVTSTVAAANQILDAKLDGIYKTYVKLPVLGLSLGYRF